MKTLALATAAMLLASQVQPQAGQAQAGQTSLFRATCWRSQIWLRHLDDIAVQGPVEFVCDHVSESVLDNGTTLIQLGTGNSQFTDIGLVVDRHAKQVKWHSEIAQTKLLQVYPPRPLANADRPYLADQTEGSCLFDDAITCDGAFTTNEKVVGFHIEVRLR